MADQDAPGGGRQRKRLRPGLTTDVTFQWRDEDGEDRSRTVRAQTVPCPVCEGFGSHSHRLGSFTESEWADQDFDWKCDYLAGEYDEECEECQGTGWTGDEQEAREALTDEERREVEAEEDYEQLKQWERANGY